MSSTSLIIGLGALSVLGIASYVFLMIFYPEWVGITGKVALEAEKSHMGNRESDKGEMDKSFLAQIENEAESQTEKDS